jgi:phosphoglycolate phosphatase
MNLKDKTHLIFDFDGTIAKIRADWSVWSLGTHARIKEYEPDLKTPIYALGHTEEARAMRAYGAPLVSKLVAFNKEFEDAYVKGFSENKVATDVITHANGRTLSIWSSNSESTILRYLKEKDFEKYFSIIIAREQVEAVKPDPDGFSHIQDPHIPIENYLFIGDSGFDKEAAKAAGVDFLHVRDLGKLR